MIPKNKSKGMKITKKIETCQEGEMKTFITCKGL